MARKPQENETDTAETTNGGNRESTAVVPVTDAFITTGTGHQFKVKKFVNIPVISLRTVGTEIICRILDAIHTGSVEHRRKGGAERKPADVVTVEASNGAQGTIIVSEIMKTELMNNYPNDSYVGAWFHIKRTDTKRSTDGNEYGLYAITELEPPAGQRRTIDA